jgi:hypothetical protein
MRIKPAIFYESDMGSVGRITRYMENAHKISSADLCTGCRRSARIYTFGRGAFQALHFCVIIYLTREAGC